ncbi:MAG TPA: FAD binding domain-containing protein [Xanthobacteraceae bacterium]|nr:FAD binding domain-containing protein [Xanthobacteraceae bacterium]
MKPVPFDYIRPRSIEETCALLAQDAEARVIAGGQSLVPMLAMRLARPTRLIDILRLPALAGIRDNGDSIVIGATTKQAAAERDPQIAAKLPLLAKVFPWVGHPATRRRGTIGGSIAHADPSAEIPLAALTLGADIIVRDANGETTIKSSEFFLGPMVTAIPQGALLTAIRFPVWPQQRLGTGFHEVNARHSDFAFVCAAAQVALDEAGRCSACAIGVGGLGEYPVRLDHAADALVGSDLGDATIADAVATAMAQLDIWGDLHASADYRRRTGGVLARRALSDAREVANKTATARRQ